MDAVNEVVTDKNIVLDRCRELCEEFRDTTELDNEIEDHMNECEVIAELNRKLINDKAIDHALFIKKHSAYERKYLLE